MGELSPNMHVLTALWALASTTAAFTTFQVDNFCGKEIALGLEKAGAAILMLTTSSDCRGSTLNCQVNVRSDEGSHIMLSFLSMNLSSSACGDDYVQIFSNDNGGIQGVNMSAKFCRDTTPDFVIISSNNITVRFVTKGHVQGKGFQLMMTQFHEGPCGDGEFACHNGRCIHDDLVCDTWNYDNCGDHSDSCPLGVNMIISIIVAVVLFILVVFLVGLSLWYRMHSPRHAAERRQQILFMRLV